VYYLALPAPQFPDPPSDVIRSGEPADIEDDLRRAYFTNLDRQEVMTWYQYRFDKSDYKIARFFSYRLNYPPENAQIIIRDQTRSTFLEEIVHPFRESIYINGFEPNLPNEVIFVEGKDWRQKIIVKYIPGSLIGRLFVGVSILGLISLVYMETKRVVTFIYGKNFS
jgi:hypothetical protein